MAEGALGLAACPYERDLETERTDSKVTSLTGFLSRALVSEEIGLRAQLGARRGSVVVDRGPSTPRGGQRGDSDILMAPASLAGAHQVAEVIRAFVHGELGDVFAR
ncbi:hypothetical protein [Streptomyces sp. R33]|uniref:Uncharacterized protein n=1 Tax=Streptomyces sp. R33 TaxID=3238629 RepID=A0AB39YHA1_9ACTN